MFGNVTTTAAADTGLARWTFRLRVSSAALAALSGEWDRCRWVWNERVAKSKAVHLRNQATGGKQACGPVEPLPETGRVIGIDWGVKETATTTGDAYDLPHPEHGRKAASRLARYQRMMARRRPTRGQAESKGYRQAKRKAAKAYKKAARQRQDTARKWAKKVVIDHDEIAVEDFRPKFLARTTTARKAADAAIGATKQALIEMGRKHGRAVHLIHPAHTTMDCAPCGARAKHALPLGERTYTCTACGASSPQGQELRTRDARPGRSEPGRR